MEKVIPLFVYPGTEGESDLVPSWEVCNKAARFAHKLCCSIMAAEACGETSCNISKMLWENESPYMRLFINILIEREVFKLREMHSPKRRSKKVYLEEGLYFDLELEIV